MGVDKHAPIWISKQTFDQDGRCDYVLTYFEPVPIVNVREDTGPGYKERTIIIRRTEPSIKATDELKCVLNGYFFGTSYDPNQTVVEGVRRFGVDRLTDESLKTVASIVRTGSGTAVKHGAKHIPLVGNISFMIYDIAKENDMNKEREITGDNLVALTKDAGISVKFGLDVNVIRPEGHPAATGKSHAIISPGRNTPTRIHNYNTWVEWKLKQDITQEVRDKILGAGSVKDELGNPTGKIIADDLTNNPINITAMWDDGGPMSIKEQLLVFETLGEVVIVEDSVGIHLREQSKVKS
jgi:hypothetical protein